MDRKEIIITIVAAVISSGIFNIIITSILYKSNLKKELKFKGNNLQASEIEASLQAFRELELKIKTQELYNAEEELRNRGAGVNFFGGEAIYPAIFNDWDSINEYHELISECRKKYEKNLSCKLALNLVFIDRYIWQACLFMAENGADLPFWGTILIADLRNWQAKVDKMIVSKINKYTYRLESHETKKWLRLRKKELDQQYESTVLHYLITGRCNRKDSAKMKLVDGILHTMATEPALNNAEMQEVTQ